jgi:thiamine transport system permease protein
LVVLGIFFALPVSAMIARGLFPQGSLDLSAVGDVLSSPRTGKVVWFTLWSSGLATLLTVVIGLPLAFVAYRLSFPGRWSLRVLLSVPFVLPTIVVAVAFSAMFGGTGPLAFLGWDGTPPEIVAAMAFFNISVVVRIVGTRWAALDRRPAEAAAVLGASPWRVFRGIVLPALRPSIASAVILVFLFCATSFGVVLTLGGLRYSTVETEIYLQTVELLDLRTAAVLSLLQLVIVTALLVLTHRLGRPATSDAGAATGSRRPVRGDLPVLALGAILVGVVTLPIVTLVVRSLRFEGSWSLASYRALAAGEPSILQALRNSLAIATDATLFSVGLGLLVAVVVTRRPAGRLGRRLLGGLEGAFMLPLGVSAVTVGFGFLIALDRPPLDLRASAWLVPIAQALVALPVVVRMLVPTLAAVDNRQRQAAATLGAGPARVVWTVDIPLVWRPLLAAVGFAFAISMGEFGATSFLVRPDAPTLPILIFRELSHPGALALGSAVAGSVVLGLITAGVMAVIETVRTEKMEPGL